MRQASRLLPWLALACVLGVACAKAGMKTPFTLYNIYLCYIRSGIGILGAHCFVACDTSSELRAATQPVL
jgi:hypothetical protein